MLVIEQTLCRVAKRPLVPLLDLGELPLSCFPMPQEAMLKKSPLKLGLSPESGLVQLFHTVDPDTLYSQYWYFSGVNQSMRDALHSIVQEGLKRRPLRAGDVVLDIAANDGTLLSS